MCSLPNLSLVDESDIRMMVRRCMTGTRVHASELQVEQRQQLMIFLVTFLPQLSPFVFQQQQLFDRAVDYNL
ncbi:hypothetical protein FOZ60_015747 [Perkinsus olseni]|uniref:Uncharacterized protein n=1 Tax=Perkinsus olseni TaxID=32597 RepID=A0A7J6P7M0_PEROL|nr:hypothetical protein FOZ60_015747 [Perkinsus olseni]